MSSTQRVRSLIEQAIEAVKKEIEAVRERPSRDRLENGKRKQQLLNTGESTPASRDYVFETNQSSIQYAESVRAQWNGEEIQAEPVAFDEEKITLRFGQDMGDKLPELEVEWENDFVLRRMLDKLMELEDGDEESYERIASLFWPDEYMQEQGRENSEVEIEQPESIPLNEAQIDSLAKAMNVPILMVWGPPGTGKTASLGYIMAHYLKHEKSVLFASNTNRAVDVGLLSAINALHQMGWSSMEGQTVRFGEAALDSKALEQRLFETHIEQKKAARDRGKGSLWQTFNRYNELRRQKDEYDVADQDLPKRLELELQLLEQKIEDAGGERLVEEKLEKEEELSSVNEHSELARFNLVATTLARICTSELLNDLEYDAVVIDEASMAMLPYLMVLAAKSRKHIIIVGDPMQLPPIAVTNDKEARSFLEQDIFAYASGARSSSDLFAWHDAHPGYTSFFNIQYRLRNDLAQVISSVFYEGRLKSADHAQHPGNQLPGENQHARKSIYLLDSSARSPEITQEKGGGRFQPYNEVHTEMMAHAVEQIMTRKRVPPEEIGVIVPFRYSVYQTKKTLARQGLRSVEVGTIHTFQGREKRAILFDTVMSGQSTRNGARHFSVRPFDETKNGLSVPRLLNVAFSRSKEYLVVIADMRHIKHVYKGKFLGRLLSRLWKESGVLDV